MKLQPSRLLSRSWPRLVVSALNHQATQCHFHPRWKILWVPLTSLQPRSPDATWQQLYTTLSTATSDPIRNLIQLPNTIFWNASNSVRLPASYTYLRNQCVFQVWYDTRALEVITKVPQASIWPSITQPHTPTEIVPFGQRSELPSECRTHQWQRNRDSQYTFEVGSDGSVKRNRGTFA